MKPIIKVDGRGTDEADHAFVLEEDGGSLGDEGLEVDEVKCGCIKHVSKFLVQGCDSISRDSSRGGVLSSGKDLLLLGEGGESIAAKKARVEHGVWSQ